MSKSMKLASVAAAGALLLAACAEAPSTNQSPTTATSSTSAAAAGDFKACMVSDFGGFDDKSFNETSYKGLLDAKEKLGIETAELESKAQDEYSGNLEEMVAQNCNVIVTVGFALASSTEEAAKQNPNIKFTIVDYSSFDGVDNAKGLLFNVAEPAFMAGYVAASMSETDTVGTFGGEKYPTVTIFMDGFVQGVEYYNQTKGTQVKVLGWDRARQDGQFVESEQPFDDQSAAKSAALNLISQGADIILPVAGPSGLGALLAAQESGGKVNAIWVDTDGYVSAPEYKDVIITSIEKSMDLAVFEAIKAAKEGTFNSDPYVGTLANGGVDISEFHDFDSKVSEETKAELEQIRADIISGKIVVDSPVK